MAVKLLRCSGQWVKVGGHPCWRVEKALIDMGIEYETVAGAALPWQRDKRSELIEKTGKPLPGDRARGRHGVPRGVEREVETIRAGKLLEKARAGAAAVSDATGSSGENPPA
jgi:hypothetical protein